MSESIKHLGTLYCNPFVLGHVLYSFYEKLPDKDRSFLLSYLVFPITLYPASQKYLTQKKHPMSSLRILAREHERLFGLENRIQEYKHITNTTMQYALDMGVIGMNQNQTIVVINKWPKGFVSPPHASKAAQRLGEFMGKYDVPTSFRMLGVKSL